MCLLSIISPHTHKHTHNLELQCPIWHPTATLNLSKIKNTFLSHTMLNGYTCLLTTARDNTDY